MVGWYGSLEKYIDPATKDGFLAKVNECVDWLYGDGENAQLNDYQDRLKAFRDVGEPVKKRHWYYTEINPVLESHD